MVDGVEELLEIDVDHPASTFLDVRARFAHGAVRGTARSEAVAVLGEAGIESRLQDLQEGLLDEPIEHGRDAELSLAAAALGDHVPSHRLRLVGAREQLLADLLPVRDQVRRQVIHGHPVDAWAALVLTNSLQRGLQVLPFERELEQRLLWAARSWALVPRRRRRRFRASLLGRGFTPALKRKLQLLGHLRHGVFETSGVSPFPTFGPSSSMARLLRPLLTSRSTAALSAASPFQARGEISPGKNIGLRRVTTGSTQPRFDHESFAVLRPLALLGCACYPVSVRWPAVSFPASFTPASRSDALRFSSVAVVNSWADFHRRVDVHAGHTEREGWP